ncbi:MAG: XRE family transcriptional regulator [Gammaproteobacteria bacterium]|nr:MAG: XRE family transcriptional regulator [Gammaproteobacteria bacterium]
MSKENDKEEVSALEGLGTFLEGWKELSTSALKYAAEKTRDQAAKAIKQTPEQMERMGKAGRSLRDLREVAGLTINELAQAIDLKDSDLLKAVEEGKAALPFEILLRLASFYSRNDPLPFILKYVRTYSPRISELLERIGIDRLAVTAERELQLLKIYRNRDAARKLSDEGFKKVLAFTEQAFDMALHFAQEQESITTESGEEAPPPAEERPD